MNGYSEPYFKISQIGEIERKTNEKVGPGLLVFPIASESIKQQQKINK